MSKKPITAAFTRQRSLDLGDNGSESLAINKNHYISIAVPRSELFIRFKSFITDYSRSAESEYEETTFAVATSPRAIKGPVKNKIKIAFEVPSQTLNEARVNLLKVQKFCRFFLSAEFGKDNDLDHFTHNPEYYTVYILFANFIHGLNDGEAKNFHAETYDDVINYGQKCIIDDFSFEFDLGVGMFEGGDAVSWGLGKFFPKSMKIDLSLTPMVESVTIDGYGYVADENKNASFIGYGGGWSADAATDEDVWKPLNYPFGIDYDGEK